MHLCADRSKGSSDVVSVSHPALIVRHHSSKANESGAEGCVAGSRNLDNAWSANQMGPEHGATAKCVML